MAFSVDDNIDAPAHFDGGDLAGDWYVDTVETEYYLLVKTAAEVGDDTADKKMLAASFVDTYFRIIV